MPSSVVVAPRLGLSNLNDQLSCGRAERVRVNALHAERSLVDNALGCFYDGLRAKTDTVVDQDVLPPRRALAGGADVGATG
ncbi:hypothetical protein [Amaricoccus sp. W119]|uniref:hypothetical protein n=1 Tax=Amaricoccus sp. W119 TaxID=3391833 RepID=UPI0039A593F1